MKQKRHKLLKIEFENVRVNGRAIARVELNKTHKEKQNVNATPRLKRTNQGRRALAR